MRTPIHATLRASCSRRAAAPRRRVAHHALAALWLCLGVFISPAPLDAQTCAPPPAGLVAWWPGDGNAFDLTTNHNDGTLQGGTTCAPGEVGLAFDFTGGGQSVVIPDSPILELTSTFTIEAWVNLATLTDDPHGPGRGIVSKVGGAGGDNGYQFLFEQNMLRGQFNSPGQGWPQWAVSATVPTLAVGVWMHVAWTYDQNTMLIYLNGQPIATNVIGPQPIATSSSNLRISGDDNGNVMFDGLIDEVSIYTNALSAAQIQAIYAVGSAGKCKPAAPTVIATGPDYGRAGAAHQHGSCG